MYPTRNKSEDAPEYTADAYAVTGARGVAFEVIGWETEPTEDTVWDGIEQRTGKLVVCMVGDDQNFAVDPEDVTGLESEDFCSECGQIGCGHGLRTKED